MQRKHVYILVAVAVLAGVALIARTQWKSATDTEPSAHVANGAGATEPGVTERPSATPSAPTGPRCKRERSALRGRGARGAIDLMAASARMQSLAVSTEHPNATLRLVSDRVTSPAAQLARQMLSDETTAILSSAPVIGFAQDTVDDQMAVFAGVDRAAVHVEESDGVMWLAPDTLALTIGRAEAVCRVRGLASALDRLREVDPALDRAATIAGFWRGSPDGAPSSCNEMVGSIHLPPSRYATGHGYWLCGNPADAAEGARFLLAFAPTNVSALQPGLTIPVVMRHDALRPRTAVAQGNRVRAEFGNRVAIAPPPNMTVEAMRYYRRGEATPPWEQPDPWGYPQVDGPPAGYDQVDPGGLPRPTPRPPGWQGPTHSVPAPEAAPPQ